MQGGQSVKNICKKPLKKPRLCNQLERGLSVAVTLVEGVELNGIDIIQRTSVAAPLQKTNSEISEV